jgi:hypothetical protein
LPFFGVLKGGRVKNPSISAEPLYFNTRRP